MFIGGFLAAAKVHRRSGNFLSRFVLFGLIMLAVAGIISFFAATQAQGYGEVDSSTIGIGASQSSNATAIDSQTRLGVSSNNENQDNAVSEALDPSDGAQRSITVKDPDPVIAAVAVDYANPQAVEKGNAVCTLNPLPTAPRITPDFSDGTWSSGIASAYNVSTNDNGAGKFGVSTTASGRPLDEGSVTVAVPASQSYLLGSRGRDLLSRQSRHRNGYRYGRIWQVRSLPRLSSWRLSCARRRFTERLGNTLDPLPLPLRSVQYFDRVGSY